MAELTVNQSRAVACILGTRTIEQAAKCAGVGKRTLERWLTLPAFVAALDAEKSKIVASTTSELERLSLAVVRELWRILEEPAEDKDRLRACALVLTSAIKWREETDLIQRVKDLTNAINEINGKGNPSGG